MIPTHIFQCLLRIACALAFAAISSPPAFGQERQDLEKEWQSCEGGYYTGPREGRRSYVMDKYLWVVTPAFAKRFCMPDSMISHELKGAEAIAFRMVDGADNDKCSVDDGGKAHCTANKTARFEIYLPQSLNLPATSPEVDFYYGQYTDSDRLLDSQTPPHGVGERLTRSERYKRGEYRLPDSRLPRFGNLASTRDRGHRFGFIYAHEGKIRWPVAPLLEAGFRGNLLEGMDLVILEQQIGIFFGFEMDHYYASKVQQGTPLGQYLIVMDKRYDSRDDPEKNLDTDYAHVVYLPRQFGQTVRAAGMKTGGDSWVTFTNAAMKR